MYIGTETLCMQKHVRRLSQIFKTRWRRPRSNHRPRSRPEQSRVQAEKPEVHEVSLEARHPQRVLQPHVKMHFGGGRLGLTVLTLVIDEPPALVEGSMVIACREAQTVASNFAFRAKKAFGDFAR